MTTNQDARAPTPIAVAPTVRSPLLNAAMPNPNPTNQHRDRTLRRKTTHDPLHDLYVNGELRYCWCMCLLCWDTIAVRCCCRDCGCWRNAS